MIDKVFSTEQLNRSLKVLFVDDEPDQCHIYERIFEGRCAIEIAKNTKEAKAILAANPGEIAVVVSDMRMPSESGIELLKHVRENYPAVIRILASAFAGDDPDAALSAINDAAVHRYLQKPMDIDFLRQEVKTAIETYLHGTLETHSAHSSMSLFEEFKEACDKWTLHNVDLSQEIRALDYGLCGIVSVFRSRASNLLSSEVAEEFIDRMDEYVDNILCSSMLFSHTDTKGQFYLDRSNDIKH